MDRPTVLTPRGIDAPPVLNVTIAGGGPVGLSLALMLDDLMGDGSRCGMRLTDAETAEAIGIDPVRQVFTACIQASPWMMERGENGFTCATHDTYFLPALLRNSPLWGRVEEGLRMFGIAEENLTAVTCFRLDMVARPRFSAQLFALAATTDQTGALHTLVVGEPWDSATVGGDEVDVDWLLPAPEAAAAGPVLAAA